MTDSPITASNPSPGSRHRPLGSALRRMGAWLGGGARSVRIGGGEGVGPIGLDIGVESLNLVQLRGEQGGRFRLLASACLQHERDSLLASPAVFKAQLAEARRRKRFSGNRVVTALPAQDVRILSLPYDTSGGKSDAAAITQVLRERLDKDLSDYVIDYLPVRTESHVTDRLALVAAAPRQTVIGYLELLRKAGLEVVALEIGPSAIKRLITALSGSDISQNQLAINFGETSSYLTVVSGRRLLQDQEVAFGERDMLGQIGKALQVSPEEARALVVRYGLAAQQAGGAAAGNEGDVARTLVEIVKPRLLQLVDEINRVLIYAASETRGASLSQIHMLGSLARWRGIEGLLQSMLEIPVATLDDPLALLTDGGEGKQCGPGLAIATGLALRGMSVDE